jgi:lipopolysaccharide/colanic/teichoic acid biosynthesis glycosyltransferase/carbonic anhydrase/acetyltransferase-like protein (isoleucine patch superfamily)
MTRLRVITGTPPVVVARFETDSAYEQAIRAACPDVEAVLPLPAFLERLAGYEPSDHLLLADPECFPLDPRDPALARLEARDEDARSVTHLLALQGGGEGTKEFIDADDSGRIRNIQRYYEAVTWPVATGVACTLVPVSCLRVAYELPLASLQRLRRALAAEGFPSRDVTLAGGAVHLGSEAGLLALNERLVLEGAAGRLRHGRPAALAAGTRIHGSASLVGPVIVQTGAVVEEGAKVIGPAVLGPGSHVGRDALVAQCVVGAGAIVPAGAVLRHRAFFVAGPADSDGQPDALAPDRAGAQEWETPVAPLSPVAGERSAYRGVKRAIDVAVAGLGLMALSPFALVVAALVKAESRGPVFFGHLREGMGGRPFRCWKFRTMRVGADVQQRTLQQLNQVDGPQFKVKRDPRRTRVGRFLTMANIDELPQLWNVLVGDMSLVGPRPSPFRENQICVPWREGRLSVRPGVTGLWQVCRHDRDKSDFHQWIYYDLLYVRHLSPWLDLRILALTLLSFSRGGYIPLGWLLPPEKYGERRTSTRPVGRRAEAAGRRREDTRRNAAPVRVVLPGPVGVATPEPVRVPIPKPVVVPTPEPANSSTRVLVDD